MDLYRDQVKRKHSSIPNGSKEITIDIVTTIRNLLQTKSSSDCQCNIYKVPKNLRNVNTKAYTPQVISIGPFHYDNEDLKAMEEYKLRYLQSFFNRIKEEPESVVQKVRSWEKEVRDCYAEPIKMNSEKFVKLILMDGCFLVEYCIRGQLTKFRDPIIDRLLHGRLSFIIYSDLIKLENQLPFFVLDGLVQLYHKSVDPGKPISTFNLFHRIIVGTNYIHGAKNSLTLPPKGNHFVSILWLYFTPGPLYFPSQNSNKKILQPPTVTLLYEAGVEFQMTRKRTGIYITNITFHNGVLAIPHIEILSDYETYLRNLIAYKQCHPMPYYVSSFAVFMDSLINTDKDVTLLIKAGIISNYLGSNEDVLKLFNNICKHVNVGGENYFHDVCDAMNRYCKARRHRWMALLRRNYFNTPWASISFGAAAVLLILTLIQTIFTIWK